MIFEWPDFPSGAGMDFQVWEYEDSILSDARLYNISNIFEIMSFKRVDRLNEKNDENEIISLRPTEGALNLPPELDAAVRRQGGLCVLVDRIPKAESFEEEAVKFKALSAPVRLQIMHSLVVADLCPSILKNITGISDSKLSYHLDILESAGFVTHFQRQKWRIYAITIDGRKAIGHLRQQSDIPII